MWSVFAGRHGGPIHWDVGDIFISNWCCGKRWLFLSPLIFCAPVFNFPCIHLSNIMRSCSRYKHSCLVCFYVTTSVLPIPQSDEDRLFTTNFSFIYFLLTSFRWGWNIGHGGLTKHYGMPLFGVCMRWVYKSMYSHCAKKIAVEYIKFYLLLDWWT